MPLEIYSVDEHYDVIAEPSEDYTALQPQQPMTHGVPVPSPPRPANTRDYADVTWSRTRGAKAPRPSGSGDYLQVITSQPSKAAVPPPPPPRPADTADYLEVTSSIL